MNLQHELGSHLSGLDQLRAMLTADRRPGMAETLDIRLIEVDDGLAVVEAVPGIQHYNPQGMVHGGFAATLLDFACGYAVMSKLAAGQTFSTLEIKVGYHNRVTKDTGPVRGEGTVLTIGRRVAFTEARLTDPQGKLLASATSTLIILGESTRID